MHKIDGYGATVANEFTEGDPAQAVPATDVTDDWLNAVQSELVGVIEGAGMVLAKADNGQLLKALQILVDLALTAIRTVSASGPVLATDRIILIDATLGAINLTFLSAAASTKAIKVMRIDATANQISLLPAAAETIAWEASIELVAKGERYEYVPDGVDNWLQF